MSDIHYGCQFEGDPGRCFAVKWTEPCCGYENCEKFRPNYLTNGDRIRQMNDEELAKWLTSMVCLCECCVDGGKGLDKCLLPTSKQCRTGTLSWLKSPVKKENDDD